MLAPHGEVLACDLGAPDGAPTLEGIEVHTESDGTELLDRVATVVKSPGVPQEAAVVAAARERGMEVVGELELAWRLLPGPGVRGRHRHQRQDHHHRAAGRDPP